MKDLKAIYNECLSNLNSIGIYPNEVSEIIVNKRAKGFWGKQTRENGKYVIQISERLLADNVPDEYTKQTMYHELLHCVDGGNGHKGKWKVLAQKCNRELGTNITRTSEYEGIEIEYKYEFRCTQCGMIIKRMKRSNFVNNPRDYRCAECGGRFERIK